MRLALAFILFPSVLVAQGLAEHEAVVRAQIEAFRQGDFGTAFGYASDTIQGVFGTPENFGEMVSEGYGMVINPSDIKVLNEREIAGSNWLRVMLTAPDGTVSILDYQMLDTPEGARINAVQIIPAPDVAA